MTLWACSIVVYIYVCVPDILFLPVSFPLIQFLLFCWFVYVLILHMHEFSSKGRNTVPCKP